MKHPIGRYLDKLSCFEAEDERYGPPIFAALATGSHDAVQSLLKGLADTTPETPLLRDMCKQYFKDRNERNNLGNQFTFSRKRGILYDVLVQYDEVILAFLYASGKFDIDSKDNVLGQIVLG